LKTIIYLDQSYLINLTKARLGRLPDDNDHGYVELRNLLTTAVQLNRVICPFSSFAKTESEMAPYDVEREVYETLNPLYCGVSFRSFPDVLCSQVRHALAEFLGESVNDEGWRTAFSADPHRQMRSWDPIPLGGGNFSAWTRDVKGYHERRGDDPPIGDFEAQKRFEAVEMIKQLYILPTLAFATGSSDIFWFSALDFRADLLAAFEEHQGTSPDELEELRFLRSLNMLAVPLIDIHSSIRAGMLIYSKDRKVLGSDLQDVLALSTVLPYCDVVTTDRYMKYIITKVGLPAQYGVKVFSAAKEDVLSLAAEVAQVQSSSGAL